MSEKDTYPLLESTVDTLMIFKKIFAIISLILLIFLFILFVNGKNMTHKITHLSIFYHIIIETFFMISILLPYNIDSSDSNLCLAQSILTNYFGISRLINAFLMSYICILDITNKLFLDTHYKIISLCFLVISMIIPFITSYYIYAENLSGNFGVYCFLPLNDQEMRYYITKYHIKYIALKLGIIFIIFYCLLKNKIYKSSLQNIKSIKIVFKTKQYLIYFPRVIAYISLFDIFTYVYKVIHINESTLLIELLHIIFNCSSGIYIFIIFIKTSLLQTLFSRIYKKLKNKKKKKIKRITVSTMSTLTDKGPIIPLDSISASDM